MSENASQLFSRVEDLGEHADLGSEGRDSRFGSCRGSGASEDSGTANGGSETADSKDSELADNEGSKTVDTERSDTVDGEGL